MLKGEVTVAFASHPGLSLILARRPPAPHTSAGFYGTSSLAAS
ncbi:hypothetical protein PF010_g31077, partial [Phytophthora fragariae]